MPEDRQRTSYRVAGTSQGQSSPVKGVPMLKNRFFFRFSVLAAGLCLLAMSLHASPQSSGLAAKTIFARSKAAVVRIWSGNEPRGTGFLISSEGILVTANHVVTQRTAQGAKITLRYLSDLQVQLGDGTKYPAKTLAPLSLDSVRNDYALLQIQKSGLPFLRLGSWKEVTEGDTVTTLGYPLNSPGVLLIVGTVSGRFPLPADVKDEHGNDVTVDSIIFEGPANRGLSGGPLICSLTGHVVGIVTNKLVGITPQLQQMQQDLSAPGQAEVSLGSVGLGNATLSLINLLDNYLISGMGGAVAIDPLKKAAEPFIREAAGTTKTP